MHTNATVSTQSHPAKDVCLHNGTFSRSSVPASPPTPNIQFWGLHRHFGADLGVSQGEEGEGKFHGPSGSPCTNRATSMDATHIDYLSNTGGPQSSNSRH